MLTRITAWSAFFILLSIYVIHIYWGAGGLWPGDSPESLASIVMGAEGQSIPLGMETYVIATAFLLFALLAISPYLSFMKKFPAKLWKFLFYSVSGIFSARAVFGYVEEFIIPSAPGAPYIHLNQIFYSPLCILLAIIYFYLVKQFFPKKD